VRLNTPNDRQALFRSGVGGQVQTGWLGIFSQAVGLVRVMGKALRKVMITICSHGPWSMVHVPESEARRGDSELR